VGDGGSRAEVGPRLGCLSELHSQTGLIPIQLDGLGGDIRCPWDDGDFIEPADPHEADGLDAAVVLQFNWRAWVPHPRHDNPELMQERAPFTLEWPGLAPPERRSCSAATALTGQGRSPI
jgi:hypothetical protein